jgi:hypothetical protein
MKKLEDMRKRKKKRKFWEISFSLPELNKKIIFKGNKMEIIVKDLLQNNHRPCIREKEICYLIRKNLIKFLSLLSIKNCCKNSILQLIILLNLLMKIQIDSFHNKFLLKNMID